MRLSLIVLLSALMTTLCLPAQAELKDPFAKQKQARRHQPKAELKDPFGPRAGAKQQPRQAPRRSRLLNPWAR